MHFPALRCSTGFRRHVQLPWPDRSIEAITSATCINTAPQNAVDSSDHRKRDVTCVDAHFETPVNSSLAVVVSRGIAGITGREYANSFFPPVEGCVTQPGDRG